jgi:hypothetical protein
LGYSCGLEVKPVIDSSMEVVVTEGAALDLTLSNLWLEESTSRQIIIYEGHPDNPLIFRTNRQKKTFISLLAM